MSEGKYIKNLDVLRFTAVVLIFSCHFSLNYSEVFTDIPILRYVADHLAFNFGELGTCVFLVMSGFLNTRILLMENQKFGKIRLDFYLVRRMLRIWPLYFLIVAIGFITYPIAFRLTGQTPYANEFWPFATFLVNWRFLEIQSPMAYNLLDNLWTVCAEEQFYIILALGFWIIGVRRFHLLTALLMLVFLLSCYYLTEKVSTLEVITITNFHLLEFVAGMYLGFFSLKVTDKTLHPFWGLIFLLLTAGLMNLISMREVYLAKQPTFGLIVVLKILYTLVACCWIIFAFSVRLEQPSGAVSRFFQYLGKHAYGFYMWNELAGFIVFLIISKGLMNSAGLSSAILLTVSYGFGISLTVLISVLSYKWIEQPFLRFKSEFYPKSAS